MENHNIENEDLELMQSRRQAYVDYIMKLNEENPNVMPEQHAFLKELAKFRHIIHSAPETLFYQDLSYEIDTFFAEFNNCRYFTEINLPYPSEVFQLFQRLQSDRSNDALGKKKRIIEFVKTMELFNKAVEDYFRAFDKRNGTYYTPSGHYRKYIQDGFRRSCTRIRRLRNTYSLTQQRVLDRVTVEISEHEKGISFNKGDFELT